ncbi:UbiH/UbiF/VisC/COQ6 family ubiquinone biosynthesis hydroxylase [Aestuariibius insulae]|uniref:UbiH/UbiF/VisC/COQ6 family ubiquinone biosynthesis hydroxylase n=1 Tax=Aestuariibius insulae TaxID=2058287 RepID=UPI00345EE455
MDNRPDSGICSPMTDLLLTGGGLNGTALALAASRIGLSVTLIDAAPDPGSRVPDFDGRAYAIALASQRLMSAIGLWPALAAEAQPMTEIKVTDGRPGQGPAPWMMHFEASELGEEPMGFMVEDRHLRHHARAALDESDLVETRYGQTVTAQRVTPTGVEVDTSTGETLTARLLIGADGRSSGTARRAGIRRMEWGYGQTALVCAVEHEKPHDGIAHQFFMPGGPLAILPLTGNRASIVWSEDDAVAAPLATADDAAFLKALAPRFGEFLGSIRLIGGRHAYPLGLSLTHQMIADRVALVGDAAHGVHPIAGQGLNAGLKDIAALIEVLAEARRRGEDIGTRPVLTRYQQWRRFDVASLALATDTFNRLFSNDNPILRAARDFGMGAIDALPRLRRSFVQEAAGLTGDLPNLLKGKLP